MTEESLNELSWTQAIQVIGLLVGLAAIIFTAKVYFRDRGRVNLAISLRSNIGIRFRDMEIEMTNNGRRPVTVSHWGIEFLEAPSLSRKKLRCKLPKNITIPESKIEHVVVPMDRMFELNPCGVFVIDSHKKQWPLSEESWRDFVPNFLEARARETELEENLKKIKDARLSEQRLDNCEEM